MLSYQDQQDHLLKLLPYFSVGEIEYVTVILIIPILGSRNHCVSYGFAHVAICICFILS